MHRIPSLLIAALLLQSVATSACLNDSPTGPRGGRGKVPPAKTQSIGEARTELHGVVRPSTRATFLIGVARERFTVRVTDPATVVTLRQRLGASGFGVIAGKLRAGNGGFNAPWNWHLVPASVTAPDVAIEICDGRPSDVQNGMAYWINTVGSYCPWAARVIRELP